MTSRCRNTFLFLPTTASSPCQTLERLSELTQRPFKGPPPRPICFFALCADVTGHLPKQLSQILCLLNKEKKFSNHTAFRVPMLSLLCVFFSRGATKSSNTEQTRYPPNNNNKSYSALYLTASAEGKAGTKVHEKTYTPES